MTRFVLDTNHVSAVFTQRLVLRNRLNAPAGAEFGAALPSVGELWFMVLNSTRVPENSRNLQSLLQSFRIWPFDEAAAREFGRTKFERRRSGRRIGDVDAQIAAVARVNGLTVLTDDLTGIAGVALDNWIR